MSKPISKQRAYQLRRQAAGRCGYCSKGKLVKGGSMARCRACSKAEAKREMKRRKR